jgi:DNA-binding transcriptional ArsR family regulator
MCLSTGQLAKTEVADAKKTEAEKEEEADAQILAAIASRKMLASDRELAKGILYTEALRTSCVARLSDRDHSTLSFHFLLDGRPHDIFALGAMRTTRKFAKSTILLSMAITYLRRLIRSR